MRSSPAPCLGSCAPSPSSPLLYPPLIPIPPFNPTSAPALRPPSPARLDWPLPELSYLSPALLLGDSLAGRLYQRRAHRPGGAQAATAAGRRRPRVSGGPEGPKSQTRKWTVEMERLSISEAQEDSDVKDGDAVGEADAARAGRTGTLWWRVTQREPHRQHYEHLAFVKSSLPVHTFFFLNLI